MNTRQSAYFLWVGSDLPDIARVSIRSAVDAGFDTVLFTDRDLAIPCHGVKCLDWREIELPWKPEQVRLRGSSKPYFAGFANLFRYALLSQSDGWWFDCDTIILRGVADFAALLKAGRVVLGYEDAKVVNNAVIGSNNAQEMKKLYEAALPHYPLFERWGVTGPRLVTELATQTGGLHADLLSPEHFYPVHHGDIAQVYLPQCRAALEETSGNWFCLSLWNEVLSRSGLKYMSPPGGSFIETLLSARPELGAIAGDPAGMADFLAENLQQLDRMDSGRVALATLMRKGRQMITRGSRG